ncbi:type IV pilus assembly protein PilM [Candidatus Woesebacteria bacterium]|jgi:type IV pilus assembly protein PilM|nr:type IV pilus assembly protein PilM [Candidatus Woesebacteria bacterium]HNV45143.1 type IV pilus assembly protein PilM [Candidatus Woesebacteria bacterium]HOA12163.1 type IV pilus assembly protein PilM [Candidatus Woesebacteria bacterium]HOI05099.1 type IV pilus assembly protein PilM [Candidatus Woesebacteria bacterium]HOP38882.1 type IV pilus assembly protein PilM [Candidatus Woesebacteria bacterium]
MSITALDIGTHTIKAISAKNGKQIQVLKAVDIPNSLGLVIPQSDQETTQFSEMIANLLNDYKLDASDVRLSLPESIIANKVIEVPVLTDAELASAVGWQAEQYIPIPKDDLSLEYQVLFRPDKKMPDAKMKVLLVASRKSFVRKLNDIFLNLGIEPTVMETQMFSVIRALNLRSDDPETLIVHMGASNLDLAVVANGMFDFIFSTKNGAQLLTNAIAQSFALDLKQAEEYKITYGLNPEQLDGKLIQVILPIVNNVVVEIQKALRYFSQLHPGQTIKRVVLSGGPAEMIGFSQYLAQQINTEVFLMAPFAEAKGQIPETKHLHFTVCMGLVMRKLS